MKVIPADLREKAGPPCLPCIMRGRRFTTDCRASRERTGVGTGATDPLSMRRWRADQVDPRKKGSITTAPRRACLAVLRCYAALVAMVAAGTALRWPGSLA